MIRIPCRACGSILEVPQDLAGTEVQCPQCHLLNDIPTLHELKQINEDGTYVLGDRNISEKSDRLAEMIYVFAKDKTDASGNEIDLRGPMAGEENSYKMADEPSAELRPKYDPETGELIRPHDVAHDPKREKVDPASIPMAQPALGYATTAATRPVSTRSAFFNLMRPANLIVWNLVFVLHVIIGLILIACGYLGYLIGVPFMVIFLVMLAGHWANIVDEIGREERDELPRPFRDLQWYDDLCHPFFALMLAAFVCYVPYREATEWIHDPKIAIAVRAPLWLIGTYYFPAAFLITSTSGTISNLRPDRIIGTAAASGGAYNLAVLLWAPAGFLYNRIIWIMIGAGLPTWGKMPAWVQDWRGLAAIGVLFLSLFLMHFFSWTLGLIYRERHANFPWVFQFHKRRRDEGMGESRLRNRTNKRQPGIRPQPLKPIHTPAAQRPKPATPLAQPSADRWPEIRE